MQERRDAGMKPLDLIWVDTDMSLGVQEHTKRRSKVRFNELYQLLYCSLQCHLSKH